MKNIRSLICALAFIGAATAFAADKEVTLTGEGKCGKCALKETKECQNTVTVTKNGKTTTYYLTDNKVSKDFHKNICQGPKEIKVTGKVHDHDGKHEITPSKIEEVKS